MCEIEEKFFFVKSSMRKNVNFSFCFFQPGEGKCEMIIFAHKQAKIRPPRAPGVLHSNANNYQ